MKHAYLFSLLLVLSACGGASADEADPIPDVSFSQEILPKLDSCAANGCHSSQTAQAGLVVDGTCQETYEALSGRVDILWEKASGQVQHSGGTADEELQEALWDWIAGGAPSDC